MTVHHRTGHRSSAMADVITYRLEDKMVYVPLNSSWTEALRHARSAFDKLRKIDEKRITFSVNLIKDGQRKSVGISPLAWRSVASHLARYEIVDIEVSPKIPEVIVTDADAPPQYSSFHEGSATSQDIWCSRCTEEKILEGPRRSRSPSPSQSGPGKLTPKKMLQKLCGM